MTNCPTCRAPYKSGTKCYRCGTRLEDILAVEREAAHCRHEAELALARQDIVTALGFSDRALYLHRSKESLRTAALVALARHRFSSACQLWRESQEL